MRKWLRCASALCLAGLLAGCGEEETKHPLDWAIDPEATEAERKILRAALQIVIAECPALANIDWQAEAKKDRKEWKDGYFKPAWFAVADLGGGDRLLALCGSLDAFRWGLYR